MKNKNDIYINILILTLKIIKWIIIIIIIIIIYKIKEKREK